MYMSFCILYTVFCIVFCTVCMSWPSKWICPHQNHYVLRHINNRYINTEHSYNWTCPP
jgi:hypothetical protein